jgi:glutamyl-tRNA reductase
VFLYDMDDLKRVSHANLAARERAAQAALAIVDEEVAQYERWLARLELTPTIVALRDQVRALVQHEKEKALPRLGALDARAEQALDALCESIVNKILHRPLTELKRGGEAGDGSELVEAVQRLFGLDVQEAPASSDAQPQAGIAKATPERARRS